jgi:AbrB family looped-hinge helix DNA binding protein
MAKLTDGLPSKSEKMRVLAKAGYSRGDIARFLGTNYQFVRNVLVREEARQAAAEVSVGSNSPSVETGANSRKIRMGSEGQIAIPAQIREALGLKTGDTLFASMEDGEIHLLTIPAAVRKAQALVRQYVPEGVSLVDDLLEDRRREVERERGNG